MEKGDVLRKLQNVAPKVVHFDSEMKLIREELG